MANQLYIPLQGLRIEKDPVSQKTYLIASVQVWVLNYQYLKFTEASLVQPGYYVISLSVANKNSSLVQSLWAGEQKFEIGSDKMPPLFTVETTVYLAGQPTGGVTNTISGSGGME